MRRLTATATSLGLLSVTVNSRLLPSSAVASLTPATTGRSSSCVGSSGSSGLPESVIVPRPSALPMTALPLVDTICRPNTSSCSYTESLLIVTGTVTLVCPAGITTVMSVSGLKSLSPSLSPTEVAEASTVRSTMRTSVLLGPLRVSVNTAWPAPSFTSTSLMLTVGTASPSMMVPVPDAGVVFWGVPAVSVRVSLPSLMPSAMVGTRTTIALAGVLTGTVTVMVPSMAAGTSWKVCPPSRDTSTRPVSLPTVAVPLFSCSTTCVGAPVGGLLSVTRKSRLPPSVTVGLLTPLTVGRGGASTCSVKNSGCVTPTGISGAGRSVPNWKDSCVTDSLTRSTRRPGVSPPSPPPVRPAAVASSPLSSAAMSRSRSVTGATGLTSATLPLGLVIWTMPSCVVMICSPGLT